MSQSLLTCQSCLRNRIADLRALVDAGRGDVPLTWMWFRCSNCGGRHTDFVVTLGGQSGQAPLSPSLQIDP